MYLRVYLDENVQETEVLPILKMTKNVLLYTKKKIIKIEIENVVGVFFGVQKIRFVCIKKYAEAQSTKIENEIFVFVCDWWKTTFYLSIRSIVANQKNFKYF